MSDFNVRLLRTLRGTEAAGTFDHTIASFGTPLLGMCMLGFRTNVEAVSDHSHLHMGATSSGGASNNWNIFSSVRHSWGDGDAWRKANNGGAGRTFFVGDPTNQGGRDGWGNLDQFITDGLRWDVANSFNAANNPFVSLMMNGTDIGSVSVGDFDLNTTSGSATTVTTGFRPNMIIFVSVAQTEDTTSSSAVNGCFTIGFCTDDGTTTRQCCYSWFCSDGADPIVMKGSVRNNRCLWALDAAGVEWGAEVTAFSATGFDVTSREANPAANEWCGYIAIDLSGDLKATCGVVDGPTSAADKSYSSTDLPGLAGTPQFLFQILNLVETVNTNEENREAGAMALRWVTAEDEFTNGSICQDGVSTSVAKHWSYNRMLLRDHDNTAGIDGSRKSFDSGGWTDQYTTVDADVDTPIKIPTLVITDDVAAVGGFEPISRATQRRRRQAKRMIA